MKQVTLKTKKKINKYLRIAVQVVFLLMIPSIFTTAFSGVKYIFTSIGNGNEIEATSFVSVLLMLCLFTIIFGRFFCGYACAFGSVGDWIHELYLRICKIMKKKPLQISKELKKGLSVVKYIILLIIVVLCFKEKYEITKGWSPWDAFSMIRAGNFQIKEYIPAIIILALIIAGMAVCERFFCRFLCPMGAVFSVLPVLPFFSLARDREQCIKGCIACTNKCPSDIELPDAGDDIQSGDCFMCQKCMDVCPKSNIKISAPGKIKGNEVSFVIVRAILLIIIMKYAGV